MLIIPSLFTRAKSSARCNGAVTSSAQWSSLSPCEYKQCYSVCYQRHAADPAAHTRTHTHTHPTTCRAELQPILSSQHSRGHISILSSRCQHGCDRLRSPSSLGRGQPGGIQEGGRKINTEMSEVGLGLCKMIGNRKQHSLEAPPTEVCIPAIGLH